MDNLKQAIALYEEYKIDEACELLLSLEKNDANDIDVLLYLGKVYSKKQEYGTAINYFNRVLELDKDNDSAKIGLKLIDNILRITNNYYYENAYTDDDLYETD